MITHIHHINFVVHNLTDAVERFKRLLGLSDFILDPLEQRAVMTARIRLGDTWLVLVQPTSEDTVVGKYLKKHGEGFFLISLGIDDLEAQLATLTSQGVDLPSEKRLGLDNWLVSDLPTNQFFGAQFQLCEETGIKT